MKIKNLLKSFSLASVIAALILSVVVVTTTGCVSQATLASLTKVLGTSAASIATLEGNSALSAQLTADTAAAVTAIANWKKGTATDGVIQALSIVEADLNLIPAVSKYAPLIDIAIATVQSILSLLPPPTTATNRAAVRKVNLGYPAPKTASQFKAEWNAIVLANPSLSSALIK